MTYHSHADLGGQPRHGPVRPETDEPLFHAAWEPRALALTLAMGATGCWNIDASRAARETLDDYARLSYYQIWLAALERLLLAHGLAQADELAAGHARTPPAPVKRRLLAADVPAMLAKGAPTVRSHSVTQQPPRFALGQAVRTVALRPPHHTRLPGYCRDRVGRVERLHGPHVFADAQAQGLGEQPQWLYSVVFDAQTLFGADAAAGNEVAIDAWEPCLLPVEPTWPTEPGATA